MKQFNIEMLPAREGDCLWIEYGESSNPHRILIDGGTKGTYTDIKQRLKTAGEPRHFDLLMITHVDNDHITGAMHLLKSRSLGVTFADIWFNAYRHLPNPVYETYGPVRGEKVSKILDAKRLPWNKKFSSNPKQCVGLNEETPLPTKTLNGGMKLTLLSPNLHRLEILRKVWKTVCQEHGIAPSAPKPPPTPLPLGYEALGGRLDVEELAADILYESDKSEANGSSIAVLAEYDKKKVLLAGDAHAEDLYESIKRLVGQKKNKKLKLDAFKVSHHGSKANINRELLEKIHCNRYLFSTNGGGKRRQHPNREAVSRIIKFGSENAELIFNYKTEYNEIWDEQRLKKDYGYSVSFPTAGAKTKVVSL